jgi:glutaminyl-peptide cyclotransferase
MRFNFFNLFALTVLVACSPEKERKVAEQPEIPPRQVAVPHFNADSAYLFIQKQVDFGPRVPNSAAHRKAGDFLVAKFGAFGAMVTVQEFDAVTYDNQKLFLRNIVASFYPEKTRRILLAAHWDTRPFADKDEENPRAYFDGANDGGSGVGVLLEMARVFGSSISPEVGVDFILFDGEDWGYDNSTAQQLYGSSQDFKLPKNLDSWWCLGSQYWSRNKHKANYAAYYGILLDMVGSKNATFAREGASMEFAPGIVDKVWRTASRLGHGHIFINRKEPAITDDHIYVNTIAKIPMINIVHHDPEHGFFGDFHHTRNDNMERISKETLQAVGTTLLNVIYHERSSP